MLVSSFSWQTNHLERIRTVARSPPWGIAMAYEETTVVIAVDPVWYFFQYPQAKRDVDHGKFRSALDHYLSSGIHYGFLPVEPQVDEHWYLVRYPDVSEAIREGRVRSAKAHFVE